MEYNEILYSTHVIIQDTLEEILYLEEPLVLKNKIISAQW